MSQPIFDPFGEPVPAVDASIPLHTASIRLRSAGMGVFWGLVGVIVLARAVYFEPGDLSFERTVAWMQGLFALL